MVGREKGEKREMKKKCRAGIQYKLKKIKPQIAICKCGGKVKDHHFLCNSCWNKRQAIKLDKQRKKEKERLRQQNQRYLRIAIRTKNDESFKKIVKFIDKLNEKSIMGVFVNYNKYARAKLEQ